MQSFDWSRIRSLICTELEPRRLVERIAADRERHPEYPWTDLPFVGWDDPNVMSEAQFDQLVEETIGLIRTDEDTRSVLHRLDELGFRYLIGTYDEPGRRLFHINVEHNELAERRADGT